MNTISFLIELVLPYLAVIIFIISLVIRIKNWASMPHNLKWSLYPMPVTYKEQIKFMLKEILSFKSVFHNNRRLWIGGWIFHIGMALIVLWFLSFLIGLHTGIILRIGLLILFVLPIYILIVRIANKQMRAISSPIEYFNLSIFIVIAALGFSVIKNPFMHPDVVRQYFIGILLFHPVTFTASPSFLWLLAMVEFFLIYFPNSKMLHMVSKYFAFHKVNWESH